MGKTDPSDNAINKPKLLVIDDEPDICEFVCFAAESAGYETLSFTRADQVQDIYSDDINVIALDLAMPGTDGIEFIRYLAEKESRAGLILMSGLDIGVLHSAQEIAEGRGLVVLGCLTKPISIDDLDNILTNLRIPEKRRKLNGAGILLSLEELQAAIDKREIVPFFQPRIRFATRQVVGAEALARWRHPEKGMISPAVFIPLFEKNNLIGELTMLMLEQSLDQCTAWLREDIRIGISVNMSASVLHELDFPDRLMRQVSKNGLDPSQLTIEVTESALFGELIKSLDILTRLRMKGFLLSIDDFGTGYSSMMQLKTVPFSELKIDQSFVKHAETDRKDRDICAATIELGKKLGMTVVAEGIETEAVWNLLKEAGCDEGQGYYMGRPMPADEFVHWFRAWK